MADPCDNMYSQLNQLCEQKRQANSAWNRAYHSNCSHKQYADKLHERLDKEIATLAYDTYVKCWKK